MLVMMKPYGGQADTVRLTAREGSRDPRARGPRRADCARWGAPPHERVHAAGAQHVVLATARLRQGFGASAVAMRRRKSGFIITNATEAQVE